MAGLAAGAAAALAYVEGPTAQDVAVLKACAADRSSSHPCTSCPSPTLLTTDAGLTAARGPWWQGRGRACEGVAAHRPTLSPSQCEAQREFCDAKKKRLTKLLKRQRRSGAPAWSLAGTKKHRDELKVEITITLPM